MLAAAYLCSVAAYLLLPFVSCSLFVVVGLFVSGSHFAASRLHCTFLALALLPWVSSVACPSCWAAQVGVLTQGWACSAFNLHHTSICLFLTSATYLLVSLLCLPLVLCARQVGVLDQHTVSLVIETLCITHWHCLPIVIVSICSVSGVMPIAAVSALYLAAYICSHTYRQ